MFVLHARKVNNDTLHIKPAVFVPFVVALLLSCLRVYFLVTRKTRLIPEIFFEMYKIGNFCFFVLLKN